MVLLPFIQREKQPPLRWNGKIPLQTAAFSAAVKFKPVLNAISGEMCSIHYVQSLQLGICLRFSNPNP